MQIRWSRASSLLGSSVLFVVLLGLSTSIRAQLSTKEVKPHLAFRGAVGFGAMVKTSPEISTPAHIYYVTNLQDSGKGSFRDAVSQAGRTVVFDVAGVINLKSRVNVAGNMIIKGESAPSPGITLQGASVSFSRISDAVVRYIRMRGSINMPRGACVLIADSSKRLIFDHVSVSWGRWDNLHIKGSSDITLQYSIIGEAIDPQRFGALLENPERLTVYRCLWIDHQSRNPKAKAGIQFVNNVIYNYGRSGLVGGHSSADHFQDIIGNYFIAGPESSTSFLSMFTSTDHVYDKDNMVDLNCDGALNGRAVIEADYGSSTGAPTMVNQPNFNQALPIVSAEKAYKAVFKEAGARKYLDKADSRMLNQLSSLGKLGKIIHQESEADE